MIVIFFLGVDRVIPVWFSVHFWLVAYLKPCLKFVNVDESEIIIQIINPSFFKARTHGCVRNDREMHETVLLDCMTGEAGSAIQ